jgi:hypothetical protein
MYPKENIILQGASNLFKSEHFALLCIGMRPKVSLILQPFLYSASSTWLPSMHIRGLQGLVRNQCKSEQSNSGQLHFSNNNSSGGRQLEYDGCSAEVCLWQW